MSTVERPAGVSGWRKSSWSTENNCLEMAVADGEVLIRDSKDPARQLTFSPSGWRAFLADLSALDAEVRHW